MIEVERLWKSYGSFTALSGVSFTIPTGTIAGFLGPNGAGKTTAMRVLTTFLPVEKGSARVAGYDVTTQHEEVCARVGYLPESMPIHPEMRVSEYLAFRAVLKRVPHRKVRTRVAAVMEECGVEGVARKLLGALSKGYRQRLGLADALLRDPEVLILDEPTSGLDPRQVTEVRRMIEGFRGKRTVLLSSHILGEVEQVCDRIIIIDKGRIRAQETRDSWGKRLRDATHLVLVLENPPADATKVLQALDGVLEVKRKGEAFHLRTRGDCRLAVSESARDRNWKLLELHSREATLESLFLEVTGDAPAAAGVGRGGNP